MKRLIFVGALLLAALAVVCGLRWVDVVCVREVVAGVEVTRCRR